MQKGDDLEDDFVIDDFVALSGEEDAGLEGGFFSDPEEANNDMSGDEDDATGDAQTPVDQSSAEAVALKKRKRREKEKEKKAKVCLVQFSLAREAHCM
jgi:protein CMS1